jgi:diguanylate cyclase (GGDEF)-like protein
MGIELTEQYRTGTVVPLMKDDTVLGALALYSADLRSYDSDHLRIMEAVAKLASDAIGNAVRHERSETSALTDPITGLPNARALRHRFEEQADRARRHKDTFCVVMMDLDGFKAVNDQFGHQAGDHLLRDIGRLMLTQLRSSDFLCRYAGDEFVAILQVGPEEARDLTQRIQSLVDAHSFGVTGPLTAPVERGLNIGISMGWAGFDSDGSTLDELLLAADRAMYANKNRRKSAPSNRTPYNTAGLKPMRVM